MQTTRTNTELIVCVTPELVSPIPAGEAVPALKYPTKFLPTNSGIPMNTPDAKNATNTLSPPAPTLTVEKLVESMKEKPLIIEGSGGTFGAAAGDSTTSAAAPAQQ
jgi:pilus assembly protein CpaC